MQAKTPYNSIYEVIRGSVSTTTDPPAAPECDDIVCCTHGKECDFDDMKKTGEDAAENNNYVNLVDVDENERERLIEHMKQELELSDFFNQKKKAKRSSKCRARKEEELLPRKDKPRSKKKRSRKSRKKKVSISEICQTRAKKGHLFKKAYLGARSFLEAETELKKRSSSLALYHRMPTRIEKLDFDEESRLFMVHRLGRNQFRHYAIRSRSTSEGQCTFFVDYGDPRALGYNDLDDLISAYTDKKRLVEQSGPTRVTSERRQ